VFNWDLMLLYVREEKILYTPFPYKRLYCSFKEKKFIVSIECVDRGNVKMRVNSYLLQ